MDNPGLNLEEEIPVVVSTPTVRYSILVLFAQYLVRIDS